MTIPRSHRPGFFNPVCETVVWSIMFKVENVFEKKKGKNTSLWVHGMVTGGPGQKPDWKKITRSVRQWYGYWWVKIDHFKTFLKYG